MKKLLLSVLLPFVCIVLLYSQFDGQFSQYMLNKTTYNPATIGESGMIDINIQGRLQWLKLDTTSLGGGHMNFEINSPFKLRKTLHAVGIKFVKDMVGLLSTQSAGLQYAFKKKFDFGTLSVGADIGLTSIGFKGSKVSKITLGEYHNITGDPYIPQSDVSGSSLDLGLGAFYSAPLFFAGLSYSHLNSPLIHLTDKSAIKLTGTLYAVGGYDYQVPDSKILIKPSALIKTDFRSYQFDISGLAEYDKKLWGGLSYRYQDAVILLFGVSTNLGLGIGFSYDVPTSNRGGYGSPEVFVSYDFQYIFQKGNTKYKSIKII